MAHRPKPRSLELITSETPPPRALLTLSTGAFGMLVFLASLTMLFGASVVGYLMVRAEAPQWKTVDMPDLPRGGMFASTLVLVLASLAIHAALRAARRNHIRAMQRLLLGTFALALVFLASQLLNWRELVQANLPPSAKSLYAFTFYMLTGLHALHVIGGLIPLGIVTWRAYGGRYSSVYHRGVVYQVMYWHYLDAVWVVLLAIMLFASA